MKTKLTIGLITTSLLAACESNGRQTEARSPVEVATPIVAIASPTLSRQASISNLVQPLSLAPSHTPVTDREQYQHIDRSGVIQTANQPVSTFSVDVDTGSYANVRRLLNSGSLPRRDAIRVEELVNYFPYGYRISKAEAPVAVQTEVGTTPWNKKTLLMRVGIQADDPGLKALPPANIVLLIDVSGSMGSPERLPLLQNGLKMLLPNLRSQDKVSIVTYAGAETIALQPTSGAEKATILAAVNSLRAEGSTNGHAGIQMAYQLSQQHLVKGGINRILLATDGDFNVGIQDFEQLKDLIKEKRQSGVSLSTLGFGVGNYNERLMEQLADVGDGSYAYVDNLMEAKKVLNDQFASTLSTVARDVKVRIEFNPALVSEYRLIGYENRTLAEEDFKNDKVDAGDMGAGHRVTALYEIALTSQEGNIPPRRYATRETARMPSGRPAKANELAYVSLRYKLPGQRKGQELVSPIVKEQIETGLGPETKFAAAVAAFGQRLGDGGKYLGDFDFDQIKALGQASKGADEFGYRGEFLQLVDLAKTLAASSSTDSPSPR